MVDDTLERTLDELVVGCRILDMEGHSDMAQGHLTLRDPEGRGFWIKRNDMGLGEIETVDDLVLSDFDGNSLQGKSAVHGEFPIHVEIMKRRPDVNAVGHTHPLYATVFAATRDVLRGVGHEADYFAGPVPRFETTSNLILTSEMGRDVAEALGSAAAVFMRNHGVTYCGASVGECVLAGIWLDKACRTQLLIRSTGLEWDSPNQRESAEKHETILTPGFVGNSWAYYRRKLDIYEAPTSAQVR